MLKRGSSTAGHVAQHYGIGQQTVRDIKMKESELYSYPITFRSPSNSEFKSLKRPKIDYLDRATNTWFKAQWGAGAEVNWVMLQMKAQDLNKLVGGPGQKQQRVAREISLKTWNQDDLNILWTGRIWLGSCIRLLL